MEEQMIRPRWPYGRWADTVSYKHEEDSEMRDYLKSKLSKHLHRSPLQRHTTLTCGENNRVNGLQTFLRVFNTDLEVYDTELGQTVEKEINDIMETALNKLKDEDMIYKSCRLIKTGSVVEGTKVVKMDEFDFLFVWNIPCMKATLKKRRLENEFVDKPNTGEGFIKYLVSDLIPSTRRHFLLMIYETLIISYNDDWKILGWQDLMSDLGTESGVATTLHLRSDKYRMNVDVDLCMCISFVESDMEGDIFEEKSSLIQSKSVISTIKLVMHSNQELEVFALIVNRNMSNPGEERISIPKLENFSLLEYGKESGQVKTYRYAKCIARRFFPKAKKEYHCPRCSNSIVKSYYLKNIMFYMMNNHKDPSLWDDNNLSNRVIEVFDILAECVLKQKGTLEVVVAKLSIYHIPDLLEFNRLYVTKRSFTTKGAKKSLVDMFCIPYDLTFCPEYTDTLQTGNAAIDEMVKAYFDYLQNERWDSFVLILKVRDLLHKLKELSL